MLILLKLKYYKIRTSVIKNLVNALLFFNLFLYTSCQRNNVCKTIKDYETIETNPRCYYNFSADKTTPEIIRLSGFPVEIHEIHTPDGYTLTLHRIPKRTFHEYRRRSPILLQHGIMSSSNFYVAKGNESLAFMLASDGYDVWMSNLRGNVYSYKHDNLTLYDTAYWDYTLADIALKDLPQIMNYITKVSKTQDEQIIYIGHSLGSTLPLLYASEFPEEAEQLFKTIILMAPAYSIRHSSSPLLSVAAKYSKDIYRLVKKYNLIPFLSNGQLAMQLTKTICNKMDLKLCFQIFEWSMLKMNTVPPELFPVVLNLMPKGGSINLAVQIASTIFKPLAKFDYGPIKNQKRYGKSDPPVYNVEKITIPVHVIASKSDTIISYKDALGLYNNLSPVARSGFYVIPTIFFTHVDFALGKYMKDLLNEHIIQYLSEKLQ